MVLILGLGVGLFVLSFIWVIALFLCLALARARGNASFGALGIFVMASLVTLILWFVPREPQEGTIQDIAIYDYMFALRVFLLTLLSFSLLLGCGVLLIHWLIEPVMARPLKKIRL